MKRLAIFVLFLGSTVGLGATAQAQVVCSKTNGRGETKFKIRSTCRSHEAAGARLDAPTTSGAPELPHDFYSRPTGLTKQDVLRVTVAPVPSRVEAPNGLCELLATVDVLDARDLTLLESLGTATIGHRSSFHADFRASVGTPPARQEIVIRTTIERSPVQPPDGGTRTGVCPLSGSLQIYDADSGRGTTDSPLWQGEDSYISEVQVSSSHEGQ